MLPLSLYIHIPWCVRKCPYCDFNSHALKTSLPEEDYIQALLADLDQSSLIRDFHSIFIGGGTPSLFSGNAMGRLLKNLSAPEITLEANPGTVEQARFSAYFAHGINRLSIGIQSFNDNHLKTLGRIHSSEESRRAVQAARIAGYTNFNLDLMSVMFKPVYFLKSSIFIGRCNRK